MARGLRREVRNDTPGVSETREEFIARRKREYIESKLPSRHKPKYRMPIPPGCISVYRIHHYDGTRNVYHGIYRDEAEAYRIADDMWLAKNGRFSDMLRVEHKAAIMLDGRYYIVNLTPIKFSEPPNGAVLLGGNGMQEVAA